MHPVAIAMSLFAMLVFNDQMPALAQDTGFDRSAYYKVMESGSKDGIDKELSLLKNKHFPGDDAYIGALMMKKAALPANPAKKLNLFRAGHKQLESAISKDSANGEWRFLRLMIQENAPGFLRYRQDLGKDSALILKSYKDLPEPVQQAIIDYSRKSKILKPADF